MRVIQLLPDGFGSEAGDDDFVRGKVLGAAGHDEQYVCAMRVGHPATGYLDLDTFCTLEHAIVSLGSGAFHGVSDEAPARIGRARRVSLSVPSFLMLLEVLRSSSVGAQVAFERFAQVSQGSLKDRVAIAVRQFVEVCPEERERVAMVILCLVGPVLGQGILHLAQVKRPHLAKMAGIPAAQVLYDPGIGDAGLLGQFAQGGSGRGFAFFNGAFYQLDAGLRVAKQQDLCRQRG